MPPAPGVSFLAGTAADLFTSTTADVSTSTTAVSALVPTGANATASANLFTGSDTAATVAIGGDACIVESDLSEFDSLSRRTQDTVGCPDG